MQPLDEGGLEFLGLRRHASDGVLERQSALGETIELTAHAQQLAAERQAVLAGHWRQPFTDQADRLVLPGNHLAHRRQPIDVGQKIPCGQRMRRHCADVIVAQQLTARRSLQDFRRDAQTSELREPRGDFELPAPLQLEAADDEADERR